MNERLITSEAAQRGTDMHNLASEAIRLRVKLQGTTTIARYVNDAIGYRMNPEQVLYGTEVCFGTADAISFRKRLLRIHDLKTGTTPAKGEQVLVYAALFCLEYGTAEGVNPFNIEYDLRIYQFDDIISVLADPDEIAHIMDVIQTFSRHIAKRREEMSA